MEQVVVGQIVPDFKLSASGGGEIALSDYRGQKVVIYFYPKNMTPGCTQEACDFRDRYEDFTQYGAVVLGISGDTVKSHDNFRSKKQLPFQLLSDADHEVSRMFGVWQTKQMFGRKYEGIVRSTFIIDEEGRLIREWRGVKVKAHVVEVLDSIR